MKYWIHGLLGVVLSAAAVAVITWCTYAWTRVSLCTPADTQLACEASGVAFAIAIVGTILILLPLASQIFMRRQRPRGTPLGFLTLGLAVTAAGGAALASALGSGAGTPADVPGYVVGGTLLSIGPIMVIVGIATSGRRGELARARSEAMIAAHGGDVSKAIAAVKAGSAGPSVSAGWSGVSAGAGAGAGNSFGRPEAASTIQLGTLAVQLSKIAQARERTSGDAIATSLRQLDDLRASGLLTPEEHARKRREILDQL